MAFLQKFFGRVEDLFRRVEHAVESRMDQPAQELAEEFMRQIRVEQPIGKEDPLVRFLGLSRPRRPSVRLGNTPIYKGWLSPTITHSGSGRRIEIRTQSPHVIYFTKWTGRDYLGIRKSAQTAKNAPFLFFMWKGKVVRALGVGEHGFDPGRDFIQAAYEGMPERAKKRLDNMVKVAVKSI